jgi:hypothetical protein
MEEIEAIQSGKKHFKNGEGATISSEGASGGIMTLWDPSQHDLEVTFLFKTLVTYCTLQ